MTPGLSKTSCNHSGHRLKPYKAGNFNRWLLSMQLLKALEPRCVRAPDMAYAVVAF